VLGRIFRTLAPYSPTQVGTFPLGLQVEGSDLDIACTCTDLDDFARAVAGLGFPRVERRAIEPDAVVASMTVGDVEVEVFGQALPVHAQAGFRHMVVEAACSSSAALRSPTACAPPSAPASRPSRPSPPCSASAAIPIAHSSTSRPCRTNSSARSSTRTLLAPT
jgi:hypothetical protein